MVIIKAAAKTDAVLNLKISIESVEISVKILRKFLDCLPNLSKDSLKPNNSMKKKISKTGD